MGAIVGIDLGTSTTCLAVVMDGRPTVIPDSRGNRVTPSYIHVMDDGRILVGPQAKAEVISDPYSTIWATKRLIGRRFDDVHVQEAKKHFGYDIVPAPNGGVRVKGRDKEFSPSEVAAIILKYMTRLGKKALGVEIKQAVITVPAYFTDPQRKATKAAGAMIGLEVMRLINEPTAAAMAYGYDLDVEQKVAIFDLGGGTFDLSILNIGQGVFEVIASDGDSYLGGEDFDNRLVDFLIDDFKKKHGIDIYNDKMAHQRVKDAAERTKIALSSKAEVEINLPGICPDLNRWAGVEAVITRTQYEAMVDDLATRTVTVFDHLMKEQGLSLSDLDNVIMVGGMTRMPLIKRRVVEYIGREPDTTVNPDEAVAVGASIHAASLSGEKLMRKRSARIAVPGAAGFQPATIPPSDAQALTMPGSPMPPPAPDPNVTQPGLPPELTSPNLPVDRDEIQPPIGARVPPPAQPLAAQPLDVHPPLDAQLPLDRNAQTAPRVTMIPLPPIPIPSPEERRPARPSGLDEFFQPPEPEEEWQEPPEPPEPAPKPSAAAPPPPPAPMGPIQIAPPDIGARVPPPAQPPPMPDESLLPVEPGDLLLPAEPAVTISAPIPPIPVEEEAVEEEPVAMEADDEESEPAMEQPEAEPKVEAAAELPPPFVIPAPEPAPEPAPPMEGPSAPEFPAMAAELPGSEYDLGSEEEREEEAEAAPEMDEMPPEESAPIALGPPPAEAGPMAEAEGPPPEEESEEDAAFVRDVEPIDSSLPPMEGEGPAEDMPVAAGPIIREFGDEVTRPAPAPGPAAPAADDHDLVDAPVLLDVLSHTVGVAHLGGHFVPIIRRFSKLPARASQVFTTCTDNQKRIRITVLQGESPYIKQNTPLGEFVLEGIELNKRGIPEIAVTFDIDQSGLFMVSARDQRTGAHKDIRLVNWSGGAQEPGPDAGEPV
jgi:molecular chaperone DnaK (HSP70)